MALKDARIETTATPMERRRQVLQGETLATLAHKYVRAKNVINRLSSWMDVDALRAIANGPELDSTCSRPPRLGARPSQAALVDAEVAAEFDARSDKHILRISRLHHGNVRSSAITADFVHGADYEALGTAGRDVRGLVATDAVVKRGEGERQKEARRPISARR